MTLLNTGVEVPVGSGQPSPAGPPAAGPPAAGPPAAGPLVAELLGACRFFRPLGGGEGPEGPPVWPLGGIGPDGPGPAVDDGLAGAEVGAAGDVTAAGDVAAAGDVPGAGDVRAAGYVFVEDVATGGGIAAVVIGGDELPVGDDVVLPALALPAGGAGGA